MFGSFLVWLVNVDIAPVLVYEFSHGTIFILDSSVVKLKVKQIDHPPQRVRPSKNRRGWRHRTQKGHVVTKKELAPRPSDRKGKTSKRVHFVRSLIREVAGFAPYEKRITELLKFGKDKRALKVAKRKLGTHKRAKKEREEMSSVLRKMKATGGAEKKK
ncbi:large ribosomal subunit protein eL36z-like [Lycium barbarum]|uniref:large ribosomal subunit protein eL36z-like n=1 Tax=Lycium barbarum TaxID=112863 RepID=UPI00293EAEBF|nr:large ribosomal subunit protein eL36z-like [Lycium barbarum]